MPSKKLTGVVQRIDHPTARVLVQRMARHRLYEKQYRISKSYIVHVPGTVTPAIGDTVEITEGVPRSKRKHWNITRVIEGTE